jgi:hypothetical protein
MLFALFYLPPINLPWPFQWIVGAVPEPAQVAQHQPWTKPEQLPPSV